MKWRTRISTMVDDSMHVRGKSIVEVARRFTFSEAIFFLWKGTRPNKKELALFDSLLTVMIEHGIEVPTAFVARSVASVGNASNVALAAGLLAIGDWHGGAIERAAMLLQSDVSPEEMVADAKKNKKRIAGFGHKQYVREDPRAQFLFTNAKRLGFSGKFVKKLQTIERELAKVSTKKLPINVDGAAAALLSELGFDWRMGKSLFALARLPGIAAHVLEELIEEKPYRRLDSKDIEYLG